MEQELKVENERTNVVWYVLCIVVNEVCLFLFSFLEMDGMCCTWKYIYPLFFVVCVERECVRVLLFNCGTTGNNSMDGDL